MSFHPSKLHVVFDKSSPYQGFVGELFINFADAEASIDAHVDAMLEGRRIKPENLERRKAEARKSFLVVTLERAMELTIESCSEY